MGKVVGAVALSLTLASAGAVFSQEIGIVATTPNVTSGELIVDIPARPDGDKVYIVRDGAMVAEATVKTSGGQGGTVLSIPTEKVSVVQVGDRISLSPSLAKQLPASAYEVKVKGDVLPPHPGQQNLAAAAGERKDLVVAAKTVTEVGAPEPAPGPATAAVSVTEKETVQLEKGVTVETTVATEAAVAEPTPRGMGVPLFPAPAVTAESGIAAPYGQGLAAAAPVGTPYLRSPAFAGPPIIYMPQTVTRVLLPGATPYPSNIMAPPAHYVYASAPFIRTDIYTSLPYGTFYWPQGYAGTTPVEPQVPAYVTAPAAAIMSTEADYTAGRYTPGLADQEVLNPITAGINSNLVATTTIGDEEAGTAASVATAPQVQVPSLSTVAPVPSLTVEVPGPEASVSVETTVPAPPVAVEPFPVLSDTAASVSVTTTGAVTNGTALPELPSAAPSALPTLPAAPAPAAAPGLPALPPATPDTIAGLPTLPPAAPTPASMVPSLPTPAVAPAAAGVIVVDDKVPGALTLTPEGAWTPSANVTDSYEGGSVMAIVVAGQPKTAAFNATIPADGQYEVALYWSPGAAQFRSNAVPVTINTATGPQQATIDQTQSGQWHSVGTYAFKAGTNVPVVTISTEGITPQGEAVSVSVDALRLTPQ